MRSTRRSTGVRPRTLSRGGCARPQGFRFAVKAHRALTHSRRIARGDNLAFLGDFIRSLEPFGDRLGAILFQFPPHAQRDDAALTGLLGALPAGANYAFEFRHPSWRTDSVDALVASTGSVVVSDADGEVPKKLPPGRIAYVRLRAQRYEPRAREAWRNLLESEAQSRDVYAFAKHEGAPPADPFCGLGLALWLSGRSQT